MSEPQDDGRHTIRHSHGSGLHDHYLLDRSRPEEARAKELTAIKDEVLALADWTPEQWSEHRGADPIARTLNAVFDIIYRRLGDEQ